MGAYKPASSSRRDFLTGRAARQSVELTGEQLADEMGAAVEVRKQPVAGDTIRLSTRAMACEFAVIMNPGARAQVPLAGDTLEVVHALEDQMSVYRPTSDLSLLNRRAAVQPVKVQRGLYGLLQLSRQLCLQTGGAFDPTSGPLIDLWRECRQLGRIPTAEEISDRRRRTGIEHVQFDDEAATIQFLRDGIELNLGGIGKGYALDRGGELLTANGLENWLFHGGRSSLLARGDHYGRGGWPVGIGNPLLTRSRLATILLRDRAMATSGSNIQYFRHGGRRFGHILEPRTGWPADKLLSVTVLASTATEADALSTAFFVLGVEKTREYCDNHENIGAILIPPPRRGRRLEPVVCGIPEEVLFFDADVLPT